MGYASDSPDGQDARQMRFFIPIIVFMSISLYNVVELNILIGATFKKRNSLYFWSFVAATNGIAPHTIGFLLKNVVHWDNFIVYITLVSIGWVMMVTGQSLVLYSRLHLIFWNKFWLRVVLGMIITNAIVLHLPIIVLMYGSNSSPDNAFIQPYMVYEKVQVTVFCLQELIISGIYIKACSSLFNTQSTLHHKSTKRMRRHLLLVNVIIILLDIPILALEYADLYDLQTAYKAIVYSVKLKLEFNILNQLVDMSYTHDTYGSRSNGRGTGNGNATGVSVHLDTFNGDDNAISHQAHAYTGDNGAEFAKGKGGNIGIMRSTEITMKSVQREERCESLGDKSISTGDNGGLSKSSSEINLATRGF